MIRTVLRGLRCNGLFGGPHWGASFAPLLFNSLCCSSFPRHLVSWCLLAKLSLHCSAIPTPQRQTDSSLVSLHLLLFHAKCLRLCFRFETTIRGDTHLLLRRFPCL